MKGKLAFIICTSVLLTLLMLSCTTKKATLRAQVGKSQKRLNDALLTATSLGVFSDVKRFIELGADVNCRTKDGWTPLLEASIHDLEILKILLSNQANPNIASKYGYTPLMRSASHGISENTKLLINAGADILARDNNGHTARYMTLNKGQSECANILAKELLIQLQADFKKKGFSFILLEDLQVALMMFAGKSSEDFHLVEVHFEDGSKLWDLRVYDRGILMIPEEYEEKKIKTFFIQMKQP